MKNDNAPVFIDAEYKPPGLPELKDGEGADATATARSAFRALFGRVYPGISDEQGPFEPVEAVQCHGNLCSADVTGLHLLGCVLDSYPLPEPNTPTIRDANRFLVGRSGGGGGGRDFTKTPLTNIEKRFVLYYFHATQVCHYYKRTELAPCVVCKIRSLYPNRRGTPYAGFIAALAVAEGEYDSDEEQKRNYSSAFESMYARNMSFNS